MRNNFLENCQSSGTLCSITGCLLPNDSRLGGSIILKGQMTTGCWVRNSQRQCVILQRKEDLICNVLKSEYSQPLSCCGRTSPVSIVTQTQGLLHMLPKSLLQHSSQRISVHLKAYTSALSCSFLHTHEMITLFIFSENVQKLSTLVTSSDPLQKVISWAKY